MTNTTSKRTGENKIRTALINAGIPEGEANAARIWKGYHFATGETGWHVEKFGKNAQYLGKTITSAIEMVSRNTH